MFYDIKFVSNQFILNTTGSYIRYINGDHSRKKKTECTAIPEKCSCHQHCGHTSGRSTIGKNMKINWIITQRDINITSRFYK